MKDKIRYFSMFTGVGGFELGFENSRNPTNFSCVGFSEIDKYANELLKKRFPGVKNYGDATKIVPEELPDFDMLCGGFPCQPFSEAGKHKGELDIRGTLFFDIVRIAEVKKPKWVLLENVKGLTFKTHRRTFEKILSELGRIGYSVHWKIMNSKNYGTPQSRERVVFVCIRKDLKQNFQFPEEEELKIFLKDIVEKDVPEKYNLSKDKFKGHKREGVAQGNYGDKVSVAIRNKNRSLHQHRGEPYGTYPKEYHLQYNKDIGVSYAVKSATHEFMVGDLKLKKVRRLTPIECERLQGFPDNWTKGFSDTQRYKMMGNAVTDNVIKAIAERLLK